MEQSFDDLVPDNWLELPSKRKQEEPPDASTPYFKHPRLSFSCSSGTLSSRTDVCHDSDNSNGTNEDTSVNEPDFTDIENLHDPLEVNNNSAVLNGHDNHSNLDCFTEDTDSRINQTGLSSHASENRIVNGDSKSELQMTKCLANNQDSRVHSCHSDVESKDIRDTGYQQISGNGEPGCLEPEASSLKPGSSKEPSSSETVSRLTSISSLVTDAKVISEIVPNKDFTTIYKLLLEHREKADRLDIVTFQLTNSDSAVSAVKDSPSVVDILEEVQLVSQAVPSADVNEIYTLLEQLSSSSRVQDVIAKVKSSVNTSHGVESSACENVSVVENSITSLPEEDSLLENDPLFHDMRTIAKLFPEKDRNEIYALLEAKVNQENRLESVINEILYGQTVGGDGTQHSQPAASAANTIEDTANTTNTIEDAASSVVTGDTMGQDMERLRTIFPDCDPNYLYEKLDNMKTTSDRISVLAAEMFEKRDYPKLKDLLDKEHKIEKKHKARHLKMSEAEFLKKFPDPVKTFSDCTKELSAIYKQHADILLKKQFPMLKLKYVENTLQKYNGHLYPAYQEISTLVVNTPLVKRRKMAMFQKKKNVVKLSMPDDADEYFYHELWFVYNELSVLDYIKQKESQRQLNIENARATGELHECCCCFDDECLLEDLASCPEGHLFCKTCVIRSTEAAFGEMKTKFPCLTGECSQDIPLSYLQTIIPAGLFSKIVRRLQEEEVQQANIPDLVTCPFCPFAAIMPDPHDKVFTCLNPECLKESCRLCRELNHIPLRCNEVEKKAETSMRVYIENKISEAVMRKCHRCGKRFVKEDGCNKMTCVCGATSCYACKATDIDYEHFNNNRKCANTDPRVIHERDMKEAAIVAKNQYLLDHPEAADIQLKTDVKDMIQDFKRSKTRNQRYLFQNDDGDDDDDDSMDEYMHDDDDDEMDDYGEMYEDTDDESDDELDQCPYNQDYEDDGWDADDYNTADEYPGDVNDDDDYNTADEYPGDVNDDGDDNINIAFVYNINADMNDNNGNEPDSNVEFVDSVKGDLKYEDDDKDDYNSNIENVDYVNGDMNDGDGGYDYDSNIEFVDHVNGDLNDDVDGNDHVNGGFGDDDDGNDHVNGDFGDDVDGNDHVNGDFGDDDGNDHVNGDFSDDDDGNDHVNGDFSDDVDGNDHVNGDFGDDDGNDYVNGDFGDDDDGNDYVNGDLSDDVEGNDHVNGDLSDDVEGNDHVNGDLSDDVEGNDHVNGDLNDDVGGNDHVNGDFGDDDDGNDHVNGDFSDDDNSNDHVNGDFSDDDDGNDHVNGDFSDDVDGNDQVNGDFSDDVDGNDHVNGDFSDDDVDGNDQVNGDFSDDDVDGNDQVNGYFSDDVDGNDYDSNIEFVDLVNGDMNDGGHNKDDYNANFENVDYVNGDMNDDYNSNAEFVDYCNYDMNDEEDAYDANIEFVDVNGDMNDDDYY